MIKNTPIVLFSLILVLSSCGRSDMSDAQKKEHTITVTGSADMEVVPDEVELQVRISEYSHDKKESIENIQSELIQKLEAAGITKDKIILDDINSNLYNWRYYWYWDYWDYPGHRPYLSKLITVKMGSMEQANKIMGSLKMKGINSVSLGKSSSKKIRQFRKDVKIEALKAAKEKAEYLLECLGKKVGEPVTIKEIVNDNNYDNFWGHSNYDNNRSISNTSVSNETIGMENQQGDAASFKNIKLRYEIEVVFQITEQ